mgnify:CR=1 FL=1
MKKIYVCELKNLPIGEITAPPNGMSGFMLINLGENGVVAFHNICPHLGTVDLSKKGTYKNGLITCPEHGLQFCAETGDYKEEHISPRCKNLKKYDVDVTEDSKVYVMIPDTDPVLA